MANWQEKIGNTIRNVGSRQQAVRDKMREGLALGADSIEQVAGFQLGMAGAAAERAADQLRLLSDADKPISFAGQQLSAYADGVKGLRAQSDELLDILKDTAIHTATFAVPPVRKAE